MIPEVESALLIRGSLWHSELERTGQHEHFVDCSCALSTTLRDRWLRVSGTDPDLKVLYEEWPRMYGTFWPPDSYSSVTATTQGKDKIMLPEEDPTTGVMHHRPVEQITPIGVEVDLDEYKMFVNDELTAIKDLNPEGIQDRIRQLEKLAQEARTRQQACVVHLEQRKLTLSDEYRERLRARDQEYKVETAEKVRKNRSQGDGSGGSSKTRVILSKKEKAVNIYMKMGMDLASATELANKTFGSQEAE